MPPRRKAAAAAAAPDSSGAASSSATRTMSTATTNTNPGSGTRAGRKAAANGKGWTMEHTYDSVGQKKEVIVIDDSASPMIPQPPRKRTRAQVAAEQAQAQAQAQGHGVYNGSGNSIMSNGYAGSTASLSASTKKRKVDDPSEQGSAKKAKGKLASSATSASVQATGGTWAHQQPVPPPKAAAYQKPAATTSQSSQNAAQPPWDDSEGHYIVKPDDVIGGRYKIVRLLGQGTFGKVVEARHIETRQKVAIKVIRAVQKYRDASKIEIRVLETLKKHDPRNDNKCIHLEEYFDFRNHPCLVSELYGMSVFDFLKQNSFQAFPEKHIQDFAKSLLRSVAFLHTLKLVHTDLKPENILLCSNEARLVGPRARGARSKSILRNTEIRLIDFGSATFESEYHSSVVSTRHYRAPEIILGLPWSYPCDMFSIGCILVEFYTGDALFQTHDNLEHLAMMEVVMGKFSPRMIEKGRHKKPEFFRGNKIDFPNANVSKASRKFVKQMKSLKDIIQPTTRHQQLFLDLCVRLLEHDPDVRIKVQDALRHPYLTEPIPDPL
ncbi:CMGC/CLK protein kinase [Kwoniella heveanensis CBS 569]|nr:CMGC/CLK protein kinase [Kwoniella heveanensis CBS 569]